MAKAESKPGAPTLTEVAPAAKARNATPPPVTDTGEVFEFTSITTFTVAACPLAVVKSSPAVALLLLILSVKVPAAALTAWKPEIPYPLPLGVAVKTLNSSFAAPADVVVVRPLISRTGCTTRTSKVPVAN